MSREREAMSGEGRAENEKRETVDEGEKISFGIIWRLASLSDNSLFSLDTQDIHRVTNAQRGLRGSGDFNTF